MYTNNCTVLSKDHSFNFTQDDENRDGLTILQLPQEIIHTIGLWVAREPNGIKDASQWGTVCVLTHHHWHKAQEESEALKSIWKKMPDWCCFIEYIAYEGYGGSWGGGKPKTLREIKWWFEDFSTDHQKAKVYELYLSNLNLKTLPPEMAKLTNISYIDLTNNNLPCIPKILGACSNLTRIILDHNKITEVPEWLPERCPKLWWVQLLDNPVSDKPESTFPQKLRNIIVLN